MRTGVPVAEHEAGDAMNPIAIFQYIFDQIETPLLTSVSSIVSTLINYASAPVQMALVIYVALTGVMVMRGAGEGMSGLLGRMVKLSLVAWFATNGSVYTQWVQQFFLTTLPTDITNALSSIADGGTVGANSFDIIWNKAFASGLQVWKLLGTFDIGESLVVVLYWAAAMLACVLTFAIWFLSHVLLALFVAVGPLLIGLVLFPATRAIFERWIGAMISCVLLQVFTVIMVTLTLGVEAQIVAQIAGYTGTNPFEQIQMLFCAVIFFVFAALIAFQLPGAATALAGGMHFHTAALMRFVTNLRNQNRTEQRQQAGPAPSPVRAVWQRIRPSTGGSLSSAK
jgi:type IV secretion system protein VirB6